MQENQISVTVFGKIVGSGVFELKDSAVMTLTLLNPCYSKELVQIMPSEMSEPDNYSTFTPQMTWQFPSFRLETTYGWDYSECGQIVYRASVNGAEIDDSTSPVAFDA